MALVAESTAARLTSRVTREELRWNFSSFGRSRLHIALEIFGTYLARSREAFAVNRQSSPHAGASLAQTRGYPHVCDGSY